MEEKSLIGQIRAAASKLRGCKLLGLNEVETESEGIRKAPGLTTKDDANSPPGIPLPPALPEKPALA